MRIYLVGGALRDELMGRRVHDRDYVVFSAGHGEFMQVFPQARRIGGAFGIYLVNGCEYTLSEAADIEQDLHTRDLTVNAIAREVPLPGQQSLSGSVPKLVHHPLALQDIEERFLRPISPRNFSADPCRTFRSARFAATLPGFRAAPGLFEAMHCGVTHGLHRIAAERIAHEVRRACSGLAPARFLSFLRKGGALSHQAGWFPPFANAPELVDKAACLMQGMAAALTRRGHSMHPLPPKPDAAAMGVYMAMCRHLRPEDAFAMGEELRLPGVWIRAGRDASALLEAIRDYESLPSDDKLWLLMHLERNRLRGLVCLLAGAAFGQDKARLLRDDTRTVLDVRLPLKLQGRGRSSGKALTRMRTQALER